MTKAAYLTPFDTRIFPRPIFFSRAVGAEVYRLRTFIGHYLRPDRFATVQDTARQIATRPPSRRALQDLDPSKLINGCYRQDRTYLFGGLIKESLIYWYIKMLDHPITVVNNAVGALAAKSAGKKVFIDLMDLWHCDRSYIIFNPIDYVAFRKADCIIAWSKAIQHLLRNFGLKCVEYLPFGVDLDIFDPLRVDPKIVYEKYPELEGKTVIGYSGGGHVYHGVHKVIAAYRLVEKRSKNTILAIQTWGQNNIVEYLIKKLKVERYVVIKPTKKFNDPLRQAFLRAADVLVLPVTKTPGVYLAERTTMFQFMATGNSIVAEYSPGAVGVLKHGRNALIAEHGNVVDIAEKIVKVFENHDLRIELGSNARRDVESKYSWEMLARRARVILGLN